MSEPVKAALILAVALIAAAGLWIYFSPYQTCLRAEKASFMGTEAQMAAAYRMAALRCGRATGNR
jgi:hypothetical protein